MSFLIKKLLLGAIFNSFLFVLLVIGIQNSSKKTKIYLLRKETVDLPVSFVVGSSFILGSILGSFFILNIDNK